MSPFDFVSLLLLLAAVFGFINYRWIRLPRAIGLLVISLVASVCILLIDHITPGSPLRTWSQTVLNGINLPHVFLDSVLAFMLFAGSLHVNLSELRSNKWTVLALATAGVVIATLLFAFGIWFAFAGRVSLPWCFVLGACWPPPTRSPLPACCAASACRRHWRRSLPARACSMTASASWSSPWR